MARGFLYEVDAGVATITLDRPEVLNAITFEILDKFLAAPDASSRFDVMRDTDTLMIWQSMLRGVGIYSGCTRCYDVCPAGDDYENHLREVQEDIAEETPQKRKRLAELAASRAAGALPPGLKRHARWIGALP